MLTDREEYVRGLKEDLDRLNALAAGWAEDTRAAPTELRFACERQLERLRAHRERSALRLLAALAAPPHAWEQAALGVDEAWHAMHEAYGVALRYFDPGRSDFGAR